MLSRVIQSLIKDQKCVFYCKSITNLNLHCLCSRDIFRVLWEGVSALGASCGGLQQEGEK